MSVILRLKTASDVWSALKDNYSHDSLDRMHTLRDSLRQLQKGTSSISEYGHKFKSLCDQLAAIGHSIEETDKFHWFLCGLGSTFETFSTTQRAIKLRASFRDLVSQAESHELFLRYVQPMPTPPAAFPLRSTNDQNRGYSSNYRGRGRG
ncbi:uncharacterized protein [Rutidosis leptorrhynchoides]|uniref:uncharacterized protein n=1 Tax=Rutidosis leptorrhynchoides TaxID=125765 RepID=UPI003A98ED7F